jgi:8-oxo-dGTP diphosphatase
LTEYVAGFLFSPDRELVALIRKNRPQWQAGRLNAIGGHIEPTDECPKFAMRREFEEETGVSLPSGEWPDDWQHFCTVAGDDWRVHYYRAFSPAIYNLESPTDEKVALYAVAQLPRECMTNVQWLIAMALSMDTERAASFDIREIGRRP